MELLSAKAAEYSHHPRLHFMPQYPYLHGGGKKKYRCSGPVLQGICCSAGQKSFKGESNGSFWMWSQHEQMCDDRELQHSRPGILFHGWNLVFLTHNLWGQMDCTVGILGYHTAASSLTQPFHSQGKACNLPGGLTLYCRQFWAVPISPWEGETPEKAETSNPQNQLVPCPQKNSQKTPQIPVNLWGHLAQKFYSYPQQVIPYHPFSYGSLIAFFLTGRRI